MQSAALCCTCDVLKVIFLWFCPKRAPFEPHQPLGYILCVFNTHANTVFSASGCHSGMLVGDLLYQQQVYGMVSTSERALNSFTDGLGVHMVRGRHPLCHLCLPRGHRKWAAAAAVIDITFPLMMMSDFGLRWPYVMDTRCVTTTC